MRKRKGEGGPVTMETMKKFFREPRDFFQRKSPFAFQDECVQGCTNTTL